MCIIMYMYIYLSPEYELDTSNTTRQCWRRCTELHMDAPMHRLDNIIPKTKMIVFNP